MAGECLYNNNPKYLAPTLLDINNLIRFVEKEKAEERNLLLNYRLNIDHRFLKQFGEVR